MTVPYDEDFYRKVEAKAERIANENPKMTFAEAVKEAYELLLRQKAQDSGKEVKDG